MKQYTYEVHFPNSKEVFKSDLEYDGFLESFNVGPVKNVHGQGIIMTVDCTICYIKQIEN